jgi:hypothetical protein
MPLTNLTACASRLFTNAAIIFILREAVACCIVAVIITAAALPTGPNCPVFQDRPGRSFFLGAASAAPKAPLRHCRSEQTSAGIVILINTPTPARCSSIPVKSLTTTGPLHTAGPAAGPISSALFALPPAVRQARSGRPGP